MKPKSKIKLYVAANIAGITFLVTFMVATVWFFNQDFKTMETILINGCEVKIERGIFVPAAVAGEEYLAAIGYDDAIIWKMCDTHFLVPRDIEEKYRKNFKDSIAYAMFLDLDVATNIYSNDEGKTIEFLKEVLGKDERDIEGNVGSYFKSSLMLRL